jgi:hypothetical protein
VLVVASGGLDLRFQNLNIAGQGGAADNPDMLANGSMFKAAAMDLS